MELSENRGHLLHKDRGYAECGYLFMLPFTVFKKQVKIEHTYRAVFLKLHGWNQGVVQKRTVERKASQGQRSGKGQDFGPLLGFNHSCSVHLFYIFGFCFINI